MGELLVRVRWFGLLDQIGRRQRMIEENLQRWMVMMEMKFEIMERLEFADQQYWVGPERVFECWRVVFEVFVVRYQVMYCW